MLVEWDNHLAADNSFGLTRDLWPNIIAWLLNRAKGEPPFLLSLLPLLQYHFNKLVILYSYLNYPWRESTRAVTEEDSGQLLA